MVSQWHRTETFLRIFNGLLEKKSIIATGLEVPHMAWLWTSQPARTSSILSQLLGRLLWKDAIWRRKSNSWQSSHQPIGESGISP